MLNRKTKNNKLNIKRNIKYRTYQFSLDIIDFLEILPRNYIYQIIGKQLLRSATSVGANIIEAQAGRSRKDFTNFYHIALKSANESKYWLCLIRDKAKASEIKEKAGKLFQEATEISNMLGSSLLTLKGKRRF